MAKGSTDMPTHIAILAREVAKQDKLSVAWLFCDIQNAFYKLSVMFCHRAVFLDKTSNILKKKTKLIFEGLTKNLNKKALNM